jgi:iron-sulfur cluster assembly accessory protein
MDKNPDYNPNVPKTAVPLTLTEAAAAKVKTMMAKEGKEGYGLRVGVVTGGCAGLSYDLRFQKGPYDNDIITEQQGLKVFINPENLSFLRGIKIDYIDTLKESGFKYTNPNAQSSCGCGTSFS